MKPSICLNCEYLVPGNANPRGKPVCRAFPEGIPDEIWRGGFDHRQPLGDEVVLFKLAPDRTEEDLQEWEDEVLEIEKREMLGLMGQMEGPPV